MLEELCMLAHDAWIEEKRRQKFHPPIECPYFTPPLAASTAERKKARRSAGCTACNRDMYPYEELPESVKDCVRASIKATFGPVEEEDTLDEHK